MAKPPEKKIAIISVYFEKKEGRNINFVLEGGSGGGGGAPREKNRNYKCILKKNGGKSVYSKVEKTGCTFSQILNPCPRGGVNAAVG